MKKKVESNMKKHVAINTQLLLEIFMFIVFLFLCFTAARADEIGIAVGFGFATLLPIFVFMISPLYIVFSYKEIKIVYVLGQKETIRWTEIRSITSFGGFFSKHEPLPYYSLSYPKDKKRAFFINGDIPKTFKTKRLIKKYYKGNIYD